MRIIAYSSSSHKSKWVKTKWLLKDAEVKQYVPHTMPFTSSNLSEMLSHYATVFFKPTDGSGGAKIVKISKQGEKLIAKHGMTKRVFSSKQQLLSWMKHFSGRRSFILQKGIALAKTKGKPFDTRVMVQKTNSGDWKTTAIFCKVGHSNKVTTNYNQGGHLQFIDPTLKNAGYDSAARAKIKHELSSLGLKVARIFSIKNSGFRELGLDVAIDRSGRLWILEVNTRPQFYPLKDMSNTSLYYKILSYAKQYGRKR